MSLLSMAQTVANLSGLAPISSVIGNTGTTERRVLAFLNQTGQQLASMYQWPELARTYSFSTVAGTAAYALPGDLDWMVFETQWDASQAWPLFGPLTAQEWQNYQNGITGLVVDNTYRVMGIANNKFTIYPTPATVGTIVFEYQSRNWCKPATWVTATTYAALAYVSYNGNIYQTTAGGTSGVTPPTWTSGSQSDGGVTWTYYSAAYDELLADTDVSNFDEHLVEMQALWRILRLNGLDYQTYKAEADREAWRRITAISGGRTVPMGASFGGFPYLSNWNRQEGNW